MEGPGAQDIQCCSESQTYINEWVLQLKDHRKNELKNRVSNGWILIPQFFDVIVQGEIPFTGWKNVMILFDKNEGVID